MKTDLSPGIATAILATMASGKRQTENLASRVGAGLILFAFAALFVLTGLGLGVASLYLLLSGFMPPPAAGALTGLSALLLASLLVWLGVRQLKRPAETAPAQQEAPFVDRLDIVRENPLESVLTIFSLGVIMGLSPDIRRLVTDTSLSMIERQSLRGRK